MAEFTHFNEHGRAKMVDISDKKETARRAVACSSIQMSKEVYENITELKNRSLLQKLEEMNDYIIAKCKQLDINPEVVQNKGDLIAFLTDSEKIEDLFAKWKIELFGKRLKEIKAR